MSPVAIEAEETVAAQQIAARLAEVRAQILRAAEAAGRDPAQVRLVAVSKLKPSSAVAAALAAGQVRFGENYAQELQEKYDSFAEQAGPQPEWHFIGALQRPRSGTPPRCAWWR